MSKNKFFYWELLGIPIITLVGTLLHFCYEWCGKWPPSALFCAVNESVWEHMKIGFWPAFFFAVIGYFLFKDRPNNFWFAKTIGFYILSITIPVLYYTYTAILGKHILVLDILIFIIAISLSQIISYRLMQTNIGANNPILTFILLAIIIAAYSLFTYFPPNLEIFKDPLTNGYGIN